MCAGTVVGMFWNANSGVRGARLGFPATDFPRIRPRVRLRGSGHPAPACPRARRSKSDTGFRRQQWESERQASANACLSGQALESATCIRRELTRTRAPIFRSRFRSVPG